MNVRTRIVALAVLVSVCVVPRTSLLAGADMVRPTRGKALVCFYREVAFQGNFFKYRISDGEQPVGSLGAERWLFYQAEPGEHRFRVGLLRSGSIHLRLLPNHIYYLRCDPAAEVLYARPELSQVPVVEGASIVGFMQDN